MVRTVFASALLAAGFEAKFNTSSGADVVGATGRTLKGNNLQNYFIPYGCWCNFDSNMYNKPHVGRGQPLDLWDEACKRLVDGYECAVAEFGETCEPWTIDYGVAGTGTIPAVVEMICGVLTKDEPNGCARASCIVETTFMNTIAELVIRGQAIGTTDISYIDENSLHSSNNWDRDTMCSFSGIGGSKEKECCGADYPDKLPFKVDRSECCNDAIVPLGAC